MWENIVNISALTVLSTVENKINPTQQHTGQTFIHNISVSYFCTSMCVRVCVCVRVPILTH